jgi:LmbE family N-acetylglucosaminyl deacetylase
MLRLLAITAHPDDEAGNFGGSLRLYRDRGVETAVICLTAGQAATHRGNTKTDQELAALRRREFARSCDILGVSHGTVLDYADGQLHRLDSSAVVRELARHIRQFRPHVLLAFGPEGGVTGHTDHSMASVFSSLACHWAGRSNRFPKQRDQGLAPHRVQKVYYATANFVVPDRGAISLPPVTTVIDIGEHLETKIAAFQAHASQAPLFALFEEMMRQRGRQELFHLAAQVNPGGMQQESDLFAGVSEEEC